MHACFIMILTLTTHFSFAAILPSQMYKWYILYITLWNIHTCTLTCSLCCSCRVAFCCIRWDTSWKMLWNKSDTRIWSPPGCFYHSGSDGHHNKQEKVHHFYGVETYKKTNVLFHIMASYKTSWKARWILTPVPDFPRRFTWFVQQDYYPAFRSARQTNQSREVVFDASCISKGYVDHVDMFWTPTTKKQTSSNWI